MLENNFIIKIMLFICLFVVIAPSFNILTVHAENKIECKLCGAEHDLDELDLLREYCYNMSVDSKEGPALSSDLKDALQFDLTEDKFKALWEDAEDMYNSLLKIGELFCVVYLLLDLVEKTNHQNI